MTPTLASRPTTVTDQQVDTQVPGITTGMITMPPALQAKVRYTSRTPTYGHLREAVAVAVAPVGNDNADTASLIPTQVPN